MERLVPKKSPSSNGTRYSSNGALADGSGLHAAQMEATPADGLLANGALGGAAPVEADDRDTTEPGGVDPEAAEAFIEGKRIGDRIKYLRQRKQMGLVELGRHTGLSASFLSQLETGRVVPTLRNLARIAMVFSKDMSYFFEPERPEFFRILRAEDRQRLPQSGVEDPGYFFESLGHVPLDGGVAPYIAEFLPATDRRQPRSHSHPGSEFLYVLSGCLRLTHDGQPEDLEGGDAVFFHANATHSYERVGQGNCEALIITLQEHPRGHHTGSRVPSRSTRNGASNKRRR
jgi:transcriptional regulator with XRE-family HTH domain